MRPLSAPNVGMPNPARRAAPAMPRRRENRTAVLLISLVYCLLIARVIIPGSFDYEPTADILKIAERDALFNRITWLSFLFIPLAVMAGRSGLSMRLLKTTNPYFLLLLGFATLSLAWSVDRGSSMSRISHALTIVAACMAVVVVGWAPARVQRITRVIVTILLVGSLGFGLYAPELAITPGVPPDTHGYWHGLTTQKNQLGSLASFGLILWFHGWAAREVGWLRALAGMALSATCLILSRSSTSLIASVLVIVFLFLMLRSVPAMRRYMKYIVGLFVAVTLAYSLAVLHVVPGLDILLKPVTAISGKDSTFTARTQIWDIIRAHIDTSPLLGSGYGGYWGGPTPTSPSYVFVNVMYFYPSEAHNGYLDIINDLGYVGLFLLLGYLIGYIRQALRLLRLNYAQAALYLALMFQQLLTNLSESHWLFLGHDFIILTLATFGLARSLMDAPPGPRRRIVRT